MSIMELIALSIALGTDLFSVAVPIGMVRLSVKVILRAAVVFALFHVGMMLAGCYAGHWLGLFVEHIGAYHIDWPMLWVQNGAEVAGSMVLIGLGIRIIWEGRHGLPGTKFPQPKLEGYTLILLAISVSIDALAAGLGLGMLEVNLLQISIVLGSVIFLIALAGLSLGRKMGHWVGARAGLVGGVLLLLLGMHFFWTAMKFWD